MFTYSLIFSYTSKREQSETKEKAHAYQKKSFIHKKKDRLVNFFLSLLQSAGTFGRLATRKNSHTHIHTETVHTPQIKEKEREKKTLKKHCTKTEWNVRSTLNTRKKFCSSR